LATIDVDDLKSHRLLLTDSDGRPRQHRKYSIYKSLIFDASTRGGEAYHLCNASWYKVAKEFVEALKTYLDPRCIEVDLPEYRHKDEGEYNDAAAQPDKLVCLDQENISPIGQRAVEPCDLYGLKDNAALFVHVKRKTLSAPLSHQFNQGANAMQLLKSEPKSLEKLRALIKEKVSESAYNSLVSPLAEQKHRVLFAIITKKMKAKKSNNLPLFSRISLVRSLKALSAMGVQGNFGFVKDATLPSAGKKESRKKSTKTPATRSA
jgi:uncharacterized protein (TIGR04141 family)